MLKFYFKNGTCRVGISLAKRVIKMARISIVISKIYRFSSEQSKEAKNSKIERYQSGKTIASVFAFSSLEMVRSGTINEQRVNI